MKAVIELQSFFFFFEKRRNPTVRCCLFVCFFSYLIAFVKNNYAYFRSEFNTTLSVKKGSKGIKDKLLKKSILLTAFGLNVPRSSPSIKFYN